MGNSLRYIGIPAALFFIFGLATAFGDSAIREFLLETVGKTYDILPYLISTGAWLSAAFLLNRLVNLLFWNVLIRRIAQRSPPRLLVQISSGLIYATALAGIIGVVFEQSLTGLLATSGVVGLVLGFALRSIILDLFSGLAINLERPFVLGDFLLVFVRGIPTKIGTVEEVNWRTTKLRTLDNTIEIFPNSVISSTPITNMTALGPVNRFKVIIPFDFSIEEDRVLRLINAGLLDATRQKKGPLTKPAPKVKTSSYENGNIHYKIKYFVDTAKCSPGAARATVYECVFKHVRAAGLKPAYDKTEAFEAPIAPMVLAPDTRILDTLNRSPLAALLPGDALVSLADDCRLTTARKGDIILQSGDRIDGLRILNEGVLDIEAMPTEDGDALRFASYAASDLIGAKPGEECAYDLRAGSSVTVIEVPDSIFSTYPDLKAELAPIFNDTADRHQKQLSKRLDEVEQLRTEEERQSVIDGLAAQVRGFFKARMNGHFSSALHNLFGTDPHDRLVKAALAACALVASADGRLDDAERAYIVETLKNLDLFHSTSEQEGLSLFDGYIQDLRDEPDSAKRRLMQLIEKSSADRQMATIIIDICKAVSASDGAIDVTESAQIGEIVTALGVR